MANSTLSPGRPSAAIVKLREAALQEMDKPFLNVREFREPSFDLEHDGVDSNPDPTHEFPVQHDTFSPHVGNGAGPIG